jgi:hypothetical protein
MKKFILIMLCAVAGQFLVLPEAAAVPGERMPYRTAHFARKVAYKIDRHVVHPARRVIVRHLPD